MIKCTNPALKTLFLIQEKGADTPQVGNELNNPEFIFYFQEDKKQCFCFLIRGKKSS